MCGIFGMVVKPQANFPVNDISITFEKIATYSESRGKDSSGVAFQNRQEYALQVLKGDISISQLLNSKIYQDILSQNIDSYKSGRAFVAIGHARLVTNGSQLKEVNNQPVLKDGMAVIHNGIVVNADDLWKKLTDHTRKYLIDTEIIPSLIDNYLHSGMGLVQACNKSFAQLEGTFSLAAIFEKLEQIVLFSNNGSLYYLTDNVNFIVFASESYFLAKLCGAFEVLKKTDEIKQLLPNSGLVIDPASLDIHCFKKSDSESFIPAITTEKSLQVQKYLVANTNHKQEVVIDPAIYIQRSQENKFFELLEYNSDAIRKLRRCNKCLLPETFPYIAYDSKGVCNFCNNFKHQEQARGIDELVALVGPYRRGPGRPNCIVPFSGGRDSTYTLHIVKSELGLNPIAFTYDWGMVTDLARRNIARVCGKLGVENIIVSANIHWKRENIRKNVQAWLKKPSLGMIPLFMAGDKYFFYFTNQIKKQTGIDLNIWGINPLENTEFKTGFAGLPPKWDKKRIYSLSLINQFKLFGYVARNVIKSPGYVNQSLLDTLGSFASRYIAPKRDYYHLFDYYRWDEKEITGLIKNEYKWETAIDTQSTWRIGDGTASFYNYIYYTVAGFSENDTFRSNQIREGMLDRDSALKLVEEDNQPRYETLRWYLEIIGLDFAETIKRINQIPKLYKVE